MYSTATGHLRECDPVMAKIIELVGSVTLECEPDSFKSLIESILYQQLSIKAARTIVHRFFALFPGGSFPGPTQILDRPDEELRSAGLSRQKVRYVKDLSRKMLDGQIATDQFPVMQDREIMDQLLNVKGIGTWTAQMFLIFSMARLDVLPVGDLGLQNAIRKWYALAALPSPDQMNAMARPWQPYRSIATWYLWQSMKSDLP